MDQRPSGFPFVRGMLPFVQFSCTIALTTCATKAIPKGAPFQFCGTNREREKENERLDRAPETGF